jgi:hypothetical protein
MKKFSVLTLVILLLFVPLIVYGVYGLVNNNSTKLNTPKEPISKTLDEPAPPDPNTPPKLPNPFSQVMPHGVRGEIVNIDPTSKVIRLREAQYFNPLTQKNEISDFIIYLNDKTSFVKDLKFPANFSDLSEGSEIICAGATNFSEKEMKYAVTIFIGKLLPADFQAELPAEGSIEELDKGNMTFILDLSSMIEGIGKVKIHITEATKCFEESGSTEEDFVVKEIGMAVIPDYAGNGTFVRAKIRLRYGETDAYADEVYFVKP